MDNFLSLSNVLYTFISILVGIGSCYALLRKRLDIKIDDVKDESNWKTSITKDVDELKKGETRIYDGVEGLKMAVEHHQNELNKKHNEFSIKNVDDFRRLEDKIEKRREFFG